MSRLKTMIALALLTSAVALAGAAPAEAKGGGEYEKIVRHLKSKYQAKKVKIPFMWLARFAVKVVRPAGVKSFNVTLFENLSFAEGGDVDREMQSAMRAAFDENWCPILRVRSRTGEQAYMYMRESGDDAVKIAFVTIQKDEAAVIRATVNPEKLAEFMDNPKIFGVSLGDGAKRDEPLRRDDGAAELPSTAN